MLLNVSTLIQNIKETQPNQILNLNVSMCAAVSTTRAGAFQDYGIVGSADSDFDFNN